MSKDRDTAFFGHPAGLSTLFFTEMWERFSYYGMRGLLVLYLVQSALPGPNPGRGWSRGEASVLYGWYTGLAYLLPIVGGWVADELLGTHRSMVVGGLLIALGHVVLAVSGIGSLASTDAGMSVFVFGLALIVIGTGHFKPCVSVMVGQLYAPHDARRDAAFTIFYMGINLGASAGTGGSAPRRSACSPGSHST
jgi:POT family proton-dependent oligopeptide transporter